MTSTARIPSNTTALLLPLDYAIGLALIEERRIFGRYFFRMEREHILHPHVDFHRQNYLHGPPPAVRSNSSQFPPYSAMDRYYNFLHTTMAAYNHSNGPQDVYTSFPSDQSLWDHIPNLHRNINGSGQNCLYSGPSTIGHNNSHFPHHGISESDPFYHPMVDNHGIMSNYAPESYGLLAEIRNRNCYPSIQNNSYSGVPSHQPSRYLVEQPSTIDDGENGISAHEGSMETRETRRRPYPEYEMNCFVDSHSCPYSGNYHLHPDQQLPHMQTMRGIDLNLHPQMPSSSSYCHQMDNPQQPYRSHSSWGSSTDNSNRYFDSSMPVEQMINQENPSSEDNTLDRDHLIVRHGNNLIALDLGHLYLVFAVEEAFSSLEGPTDPEEQTGLSEEEIQSHLKIRTHRSSAYQFNLNEAPPSKKPRIRVEHLDLNEAFSDSDEEPDICVICQVEYENRERIGILDCGHEYHGECITKWLQEKNVWPVCKATALSIES